MSKLIKKGAQVPQSVVERAVQDLTGEVADEYQRVTRMIENVYVNAYNQGYGDGYADGHEFAVDAATDAAKRKLGDFQ